MTNRTREFFDFAQAEPVAVCDMIMQLREMTEDEINEVEHVASNVLSAIANVGRNPEEVQEECLLNMR